MNRDEAAPYTQHNDGRGPVRSEMQTRQAGAPRATVWILGFSILLALLVGGLMLSNTDEVPPSVERAPIENTAPAPEATQPATPAQPGQPQTNQ